MIQSAPFGHAPDGSPLSLFTLTNAQGMEVRITNYGGIVTHIFAPDRDGQLANITLGFGTAAEYFGRSPYFGALIGRCGNRIAQGRFTLDGVEHQLSVNDGNNHLHGGAQGFDKVVWDAAVEGDALVLRYRSVDGEQGYPGNLDVQATYTLDDDGALTVDLRASTDRATPVNLTHHAYFNLAGSGTINDHEMWIDAPHYTPVDQGLIPTGELAPVAGTPFDFSAPRAIGDAVYDHNFALAPAPGMRCAVRVREPGSGRQLEVLTHQPGIQFYSGNFLDGALGFPYRGGFCLEPQHFPDAPNKPRFPSVILRPGEVYRNTLAFRFSRY
ncbi:aldose epimerase family protein [Duganella sp. Root336D2]|uniref:aldose epimerase family protein n=1 Tax=Duganella sp. Root336D2 TaxID=1736518 RepID=UPI0006FCDDE9|nr:aldose epimerase family protein [Duganella sp. Root336D2]KQV45252.1 aldose epimerase [Duganella sp. Root336D2]